MAVNEDESNMAWSDYELPHTTADNLTIKMRRNRKKMVDQFQPIYL